MNDLLTLWRRRVAGRSTPCDRCGGVLLFQVGAVSYRWRCHACGRASERFVVDEDGGVYAVDGYDGGFARERLVRAYLLAHFETRQRRTA